MRRCSVVEDLEIVEGRLEDYKRLSRFHYRGSWPGACWCVYVIKERKGGRLGLDGSICGVIVYSMPSMGLELRNVATGNVFSGFDRGTRLSLINNNIRCISRVIIEPRFRGLGLASRLVRETMGAGASSDEWRYQVGRLHEADGCHLLAFVAPAVAHYPDCTYRQEGCKGLGDLSIPAGRTNFVDDDIVYLLE